MSTKPCLAAALAALAACGGGGSDDADAPVSPTIDSPVGTIDAPGGTIDSPPFADADPLAPDAAPGFACNGQPNPTVALDPVSIAGQTVELSTSGQSPVTNATVTLYRANNTQIAQTTSTGTMATFSFPGVATGGTPVDGYMRGQFPPMGTDPRKDVFVYPPQPIYQDVANVLVTSIAGNTVNLLNLVFAEPDQTDTNGAIGVLVTDCDGNPLAGAQVSTNPPSGTQTLYNGANGLPDTAQTSTGADGIGIIINVPVGTAVTVDATYQTYNMREHTVQVRAFGGTDNALTTTIIMP